MFATVVGNTESFANLIGPVSIAIIIPSGILAGTVADNFNRRFVMSACMVVGGVSTALVALCNQYWQLILLRLLLGVTGGFFIPSVTSLYIDYFPEK